MTSFTVAPISIGVAVSAGIWSTRFSVAPIKIGLSFPDAELAGNYTVFTPPTAVTLDRLEYNLPVVNEKLFPTGQFQQRWQTTVEQIETAIRALGSGQNNLTQIVQGLQAALAAISAVSSKVTQVQETNQQQNDLQRVRDSYSDDGVLSSSNTGDGCTIHIAAHNRNYLSPQEAVALDAGSIAGLRQGTIYYVYYDDETLSGGAVTYAASVNEEEATASLTYPYRHKIGAITTPATTGGGTTGGSGIPSWKLGYKPGEMIP